MLKRIMTLFTTLLLIVAIQGLSVAEDLETNSELVYVTSTADGESYRVELINPDSGNGEILLEGQGNRVPSSLTWSPDGNKLALTAFPNDDLTTQDIALCSHQAALTTVASSMIFTA